MKSLSDYFILALSIGFVIIFTYAICLKIYCSSCLGYNYTETCVCKDDNNEDIEANSYSKRI
jgi:hypothetical protein